MATLPPPKGGTVVRFGKGKRATFSTLARNVVTVGSANLWSSGSSRAGGATKSTCIASAFFIEAFRLKPKILFEYIEIMTKCNISQFPRCEMIDNFHKLLTKTMPNDIIISQQSFCYNIMEMCV